MKKTIVSVVIIGVFVIYCFLYGRASLTPIIPATAVDSRPSSSATAPASTSTGATAPAGTTTTPVPGALYKDGSYIGSVDDAQWGVVQVKAIITNGKITDVQFLQYPNDRSRSVYINSIADPRLTSEAISAQSANVDIITGATDSSLAFIQSLTDALSQARA
ncbi:MAG TPA: FMN-binding protein [Ktedonobacteraceae bacterium]|nr:FMN-binding protein [Ktedonobacteraceae bacterium]